MLSSVSSGQCAAEGVHGPVSAPPSCNTQLAVLSAALRNKERGVNCELTLQQLRAHSYCNAHEHHRKAKDSSSEENMQQQRRTASTNKKRRRK